MIYVIILCHIQARQHRPRQSRHLLRRLSLDSHLSLSRRHLRSHLLHPPQVNRPISASDPIIYYALCQ